MSETKKPYAVYSSSIKQRAKAHRVTASYMFDYLEKDLGDVVSKAISSGENLATASFLIELTRRECLNLEMSILDGEATHIYVPDDEMCDWLVSCVSNMSNPDLYYWVSTHHPRGIVVHPLSSSKYKCFAVRPFSCPVVDVMRVRMFDDERVCPMAFCFSTSSGMDEWSLYSYFRLGEQSVPEVDDYSPEETHAMEMLEYSAKLAMGISLYAHCFPDAVVDGVPEDLKRPANHRHETSKTLTQHPSIAQKSDGSVSPHYRRGHFRFLKSSRFKNARWKTVFVHDSFVKGRAKTVLTPEQVDAAT